MTKTLILSPFARLEGQLRVEVQIKDGSVSFARVSGHLFRGFEWMLRGREPLEALVILCRICGQCSLAHSVAAATALRSAYNASAPRNGYLVGNVAAGVETILNHMLQFYTSFAPDLAQAPYNAALTGRFALEGGRAQTAALRTRRHLLALMGLFAGKWPNSLALQPGGTTRALNISELSRAAGILREFRASVEEQVLGGPIQQWLEVASAAQLDKWLADKSHAASDLGVFLREARAHGLDALGAGPQRFLSSGGFALGPGEFWLKPGFHVGTQKVKPGGLEFQEIIEHCRYAWYGAAQKPLAREGQAEPEPDKDKAYSWGTAPRYKGFSAEVGPLARMINDGDALACDLLAKQGPSVYLRVLMRWHETFRLTEQIEKWIAQIEPEAPFFSKETPCETGSAVALTEAPRGILAHWVQIEKGRIRNYQVITPTGWNFSPRDGEDAPGPVEQALTGTPVADADKPLAISHVVRSFDPCLFCMVH